MRWGRLRFRDYTLNDICFRPTFTLLEGLVGGADIPLTREFWKELKSEAQQIAAKHRARKRL